MEFIKKNVVLVVVLAITLLASAYLIFMDVRKQNAVVNANAGIADQKSKILELNRKSPAPLGANLEMIKSDTSLMKEKSQDIQRLFGKPLRTALIDFSESLGVTEGELLSKFRSFCVSNPKLADKAALLEGFQKTFDDAKWLAAFQAFKKTAQKTTFENLSDSIAKDLLLQALGIPRTMTPTKCKEYIINMQERIVDNYKPLINNENISRMTFDYATRVPPTEEVPFIVRQLQMFEDLFFRLRESGIAQIVSLDRLNIILGDEILKDYIKFSYRIKIVGDMQKIKNFVNLLQNSYADNRVYLIRDISLSSLSDDSKFSDRATAVMAPKVIPRTELKDASAEKEKALPPEHRPDYGVPVIGENKMVQAEIEFDYVIYVGDELKR